MEIPSDPTQKQTLKMEEHDQIEATCIYVNILAYM